MIGQNDNGVDREWMPPSRFVECRAQPDDMLLVNNRTHPTPYY
jgi:hypothetical protein